MGQAMTSETLSISGGDGFGYWVGLIMKPFKAGCKKTMYKGVLLGYGPRVGEKVVAKAFTSIPGTMESWKYEANKADTTKQLAAKFLQECSVPCNIRVVIPGIVQMDRVSNVTKWLPGRNNGRGLTPDEWISVEEYLPGKLSRFCPWTANHSDEHVHSEHLQTFSHFTYKQTNGALVACDFQGLCEEENKYIFTDSTIHSTNSLYGLFDKGYYGITEFFKFHKCSDICKKWPKPTPLTPPPSFDEACLQFHLDPPSAFENIVFPAHGHEILSNGESQGEGSRTCDRRRHRSELLNQPRNCSVVHTPKVSYHFLLRRSYTCNNFALENQSNVDTRSVLPVFDRRSNITGAVGGTSPPAYESVVGQTGNRSLYMSSTDRAINSSRFRSKSLKHDQSL